MVLLKHPLSQLDNVVQELINRSYDTCASLETTLKSDDTHEFRRDIYRRKLYVTRLEFTKGSRRWLAVYRVT